MYCATHPDRPAIGACTSCGRAVCNECAVDMGGRLTCRECLARGVAGPVATTAKDPNTAFLIELVGGLFGLLGLGYLYVGRTQDGIIRLIGWIIFLGVAWTTVALLTAVIIGLFCWPLQIALQIGIPVWSAIALKNNMMGKPAPFTNQM